MVKIRLMRRGSTKRPFYRVVLADSRSPRDGRFIENIGKYHPLEDPSLIEIDADRALYWLGNRRPPPPAGHRLPTSQAGAVRREGGRGREDEEGAEPPEARARGKPLWIGEGQPRRCDCRTRARRPGRG